MTQDLINEKRRKIEQLEARIFEKSQETPSFMNRVVNSVRGSNDYQELNALQAELKGLSQMHLSLQSQYGTLQTQYTRQQTRKSTFGILYFLGRHLFALYCIYRLLSSAWSNIRLLLGQHRIPSDQDPISRILAFIAKTTNTTAHLDLEGYRHIIGFILVGVVIAGSINAVMNVLQRVSKSTPLSPATSTLCMSFLAGTYFISTALMVRSNLNEKYVGGIANALGQKLARGMFEEWFDAVFFIVAAVTGVGLLVIRSWNDDGMIEVEGKEV
jgi:hypothetical protein